MNIGGHFGNHFNITLRNLCFHGAEEEQKKTDLEGIIHSTLESVKDRGFINYFGMQRFGPKFAYAGPQVGLALLKGDMVCMIFGVVT